MSYEKGLLPCPFCGGDAEFDVVPYERKYAGESDCRINHDHGGEFIQCKNRDCSASSMLIFPTMEDAKPHLTEKWNRRTAPLSPGLLRAANIDPQEVTTAYEYMRECNFPDMAACRVIEKLYKAIRAEASQPECVVVPRPCAHEWYQGYCAHCELPASEYRAMLRAAGEQK